MLEFWKNEWKLFLEDIDSLKNTFAKIFGRKKDYLMLKSGTQEDGEVLPQEEPAQTSSISLENVSSEVSLDSANGLNQPGNTVLSGHNYRNRQFFSRNKNLNIGDTVIIKDASGLEITYSIYNKFITNDQDASFYQRDTGGAREITLSTCTDQGTKTGERLIIFAKEQ